MLHATAYLGKVVGNQAKMPGHKVTIQFECGDLNNKWSFETSDFTSKSEVIKHVKKIQKEIVDSLE